MRLLADEGIDRGIVEALRSAGFQVAYIAEDAPGSPDSAVLARAQEEDILLLTHDKDFGELVFRQNLANSGVVLLRLHGLSQDSKTHVVLTALEDYGEQMAKAFTVISPGILRIRRRMELVS